jgi:hypothetical protein
MLTTAFDKSQVVNGTFARGGVFLPELAAVQSTRQPIKFQLSFIILV